MSFFSEPWPWDVAGPLIGLMPAILLIVGNKSFGISSSLRHICACAVPGKSKIPFLCYDWKKEMWNLYFVVGLLLGGFLAQTFLFKSYSFSVHSDVLASLKNLGFGFSSNLVPMEFSSWSSISSLHIFSMLVVGGFLVGFGSRYAGGCTSGHAIMGLANLQWPSLVSVIFFFVSGLLMTWLILPHWPF